MGPWALAQQQERQDGEDMGRGPSPEDRRGQAGGHRSQPVTEAALADSQTEIHSPVRSGFLCPLSGRNGEKVEASSCEPFPSWALACALSSPSRPPRGSPMGRAGGPVRPGRGEGRPAVSKGLHRALSALCAPAENLDEAREDKEESPPEPPGAPHTPPSAPIKLEEGELWAGGGYAAVPCGRVHGRPGWHRQEGPSFVALCKKSS